MNDRLALLVLDVVHIAHEAVSLVMSGQRKCEADAYPDFLNYMRSVVDSLVSHLAEKAAGRKTGRMPLIDP